jgi:hypothetical protein
VAVANQDILVLAMAVANQNIHVQAMATAASVHPWTSPIGVLNVLSAECLCHHATLPSMAVANQDILVLVLAHSALGTSGAFVYFEFTQIPLNALSAIVA